MDKTRRPGADDEFNIPDDEQERGIADADEEPFEDTEELDEEDQDEDLDSPEGLSEDRTYTTEIGSEGGSQGDMEVERHRPRVMRGSEATTTARTDERRSFDDRHYAGGGSERRRH